MSTLERLSEEQPKKNTQVDDVETNIMGTQDLTFVYVMIVMEMLYTFVTSSCDFFLMHGLARFVIDIKELDILQNIVEIKFISCFLALPLAVVCDSYLGGYTYFLVIAGLCCFTSMSCFYFVMSAPAYMLPAKQKIFLHNICLLLHGINFLMDPVRTILVIKSIMTRYQFHSKRTFFALLVYSWNFATLIAALCIYLFRSSRLWYSILMIINITFMCLYISFMLIFKRIFFQRRKPIFSCVEKVFANSICYAIKNIDKRCCKQRTFKTTGWRDFRFLRFSERIALDSHAFVGILIIMVPLSTYFIMNVLLEYYYHIQFPMLKYDTEQFPTGGLVAAAYCALSPLFEYLVVPQAKKFIKRETTMNLTFVGIGVFFYVCSVSWCSVVQYEVVNDMDFLSHSSETGHLVLINALSAPVTIRGKYYNEFMSWKVNRWIPLEPWRPLKVLNIPRREIPFKVTVACVTFSMYDDYELPLVEDQYNWFMIFPHGIVELPVGTFHQKSEVATKPDLYSPAVVHIMCRIPMCAGFLTFKKNERLSINTIIRSSQSMITLELVGRFQVSFALVGNKSNAAVIDANFERLGVYLLILHIQEKDNISINWETDSITPNTVIRTTITILETTTPRNKSRAYIYPALINHALGESLAKVSILSWLYFSTPLDLRVLCFSIPTFLSTPAYAYLSFLSPMRFQSVLPVTVFSFACACCLIIVVYFFATTYHTHRWNLGKNVPSLQPRVEVYLNEDRMESRLPTRSKDA